MVGVVITVDNRTHTLPASVLCLLTRPFLPPSGDPTHFIMGPIAKPKKRISFGERHRTFRVTSSDYPAKKPHHGYIMSGSVIPSWRRWPEKTQEEKIKAAQDAHQMAKECEEDGEAMGCVFLLHYKYRHNSHYLHNYYNPTCRETRREDQTGNWRDLADTDVDSDNEMPGEEPPEGWDRFS